MEILSKLCRHKNLVLFSTVMMLCLLTHPALAADTGGSGLPYETWLTNVTNSLTGPVAYAIALLAFFGAGAALIFAGAEMNGFVRTLLYIVLVLAFIVSAGDTYKAITGKGAEITPPKHYHARGL